MYVNGELLASGAGTFSAPNWASTAQITAAGWPAIASGISGCAPLYWGGWWAGPGRALDPAWLAAIGEDVGAIYDLLYRDRVMAAFPASILPGILSITPSPIYAGYSVNVTFKGDRTSWSGTLFSVSGLAGASISNQVVTDGTDATATINPGTSPGTLVVTDATTSTRYNLPVVAASMAVTPSSVPTNAASVTLTATGSGTAWTPGTPGSPSLTVTGTGVSEENLPKSDRRS
jgi:hypothetical protein